MRTAWKLDVESGEARVSASANNVVAVDSSNLSLSLTDRGLS
jgi:hypothetical protein